MTDLIDHTTTLPTAEPVEKVTPIKPSEAIRLGCLIAPVQAFDDFVDPKVPGSACAMGAMAFGWGWTGDRYRSEEIDRALEILPSQPDCPACGHFQYGWPPHLNDDHRWSRERIADWLESIGL